MYDAYWSVALLIYYVVVFIVAFVFRSLLVYRSTGVNPLFGIDDTRRTELVQHGLFTLSRNPIFLAMRVNLLGLFLVFPLAATAALLVAGEVLMQVQVRLEERHLTNLHGQMYDAYQAKVRRWL